MYEPTTILNPECDLAKVRNGRDWSSDTRFGPTSGDGQFATCFGNVAFANGAGDYVADGRYIAPNGPMRVIFGDGGTHVLPATGADGAPFSFTGTIADPSSAVRFSDLENEGAQLQWFEPRKWTPAT